MIKIKNSLFFFICFFTFLSQADLFSQEKTVNVERSKALDQNSPIHNIWVDEENIKWVANGNGLNKVLDLYIVEKVSVPAGTTSLLMLRGGNAQLEWNTAEMEKLIGNVTIRCASYNPKTKTIWMGTREAGAFEISLSPLRVVQRLNTDNKKLTSDQINDIFIRNRSEERRVGKEYKVTGVQTCALPIWNGIQQKWKSLSAMSPFAVHPIIQKQKQSGWVLERPAHLKFHFRHCVLYSV